MNNPEINQSTQPPLAVVGLSALFPKSANTEEFWSNVRRGVDSIIEVPDTHWNPDDYFDQNQKTPDMTYARRGGFLSPVPFDPLEFGISPNNLEAIDTSQLLGLVGAKRALDHAGYGAGRTFDRSRVGCILGVTGTLEMVIPLGARLGHPRWRKALQEAGVADDVAEDVVNRISQSYVPWQENSFPGLLGNVVAGRIANRLDLHGTNCVVDAACASSLSAIHLAALELWTGRSDMVVTGGIDTFNDIFMFMCFSKTPALSSTGDARPFSEDADGTILGEGVGILVLKRLTDAQRDGDRVYAVIKGIGTSSDGAGNAVYAPKAEGQIRCLENAYQVAGVTPDTIELVEAHGTGTKVGDATEVSGLMTVYKSTGRRGPWCAIGSVKSQIGHTKAAAGAAGVIKAILALQHRVLPPTIKVNQPPAALLADDSPFYVNTTARPWLKPPGYPRRAAVSAFGFGGSNFHCVLEESPQRLDAPDWDGDVQVVTLSANSIQDLANAVQATLSPAVRKDWTTLRAAASASRTSFHASQPHRLSLVIERDQTNIDQLMAGALTMLDRYPDRANWSTPDGAHYGFGPRPGKLGFLFPGQGSQYIGMLRDLACRFPVMSDVLSIANEVYQSKSRSAQNSKSAVRLGDYIYPFPAFSEETRERQVASLRATQIAQPAIGAVSLGALAILDEFGLQPEAVAGHSYGELTALCASRCFAPEVLFRLSMLRGELMAASQETEGGMLAVGAPLSQIEAALKEASVDLVLANHNSPSQVVLSGRIPEIDRAASLLARRNIRGKKLSVSAAFHSPLVASASRAFRPVLDEVNFEPSAMPVYANSTATVYPTEPAAARELLANQLARPVQFVGQVEQMYADGVRVFVEVGPGGVLTGLVSSILNGKNFRAVAIDSSSGRRNGLLDLAGALAQVSAAGYTVRWDRWDPFQVDSADQKQRLQIPICGANYVKARPSLPPRVPAAAQATATTSIKVPTPSGAKNQSTEQTLMTADFAEPPTKSITVEAAKPTNGISREMVTPPPPQNVVPSPPEPVRQFTPPNVTAPGTNETIVQMLDSLQRMQQETSRLHQQFLEGQESAMKAYAQLAYLHMVDKKLASAPGSESGPVRSYVEQAPLRSLEQSAPVRTTIEPLIKDDRPPVAAIRTEPLTTKPTPLPQVKPPAPPAPAATPAAIEPEKRQAAPTPSAKSSPLGTIALAVVSEKTGYPTEMLNLGMSLDHDLGIDSIKRVEILSALQERVPHLPAFQPDELGSLRTLKDVVDLAEARTAVSDVVAPAPAPVAVARPTSVPSAAVATVPAASSLGSVVLAVVSEKTGYPVEMLNLGMSLDHDLGIDSIKRVEILSALQERVPNLPAFQPDELGTLHTLKDVVDLADHRTATAPVSAPPALSNGQPTRAPAMAPVPAPAAESLGSTVLQVVAEKTGYPVEMLNLGMSLDHDLGIDSIKRVEILSALQERVPNLPAFQPEELGTLHTLRDVVSLADARAGNLPATQVMSTPAVSIQPAVEQTAPPNSLGAIVLEVVSEKTGYPAEMLNLGMSLDHDLGIDSIKRVEILSALQERVPNLPAFQPEELGALHTLLDVVSLADLRSSGGRAVPQIAAAVPVPALEPAKVAVTSNAAVAPPAPEIARPSLKSTQRISRQIVKVVPVERASTRQPIGLRPGREIWITDDGLGFSMLISQELQKHGYRTRIVLLNESQEIASPENLSGFIIVSPEKGIAENQLWMAVEWLQKLSPRLRQGTAASPTAVAAVVRLDGRFGFGESRRLQDPISGALSGLVKCLDSEWPEVTCRAFDVGEEWTSSHVASAMFATEFLHRGPVEVGLTPTGPVALAVVDEPLSGHPSAPPVQPGDVVVISGGARGVTAEAAYALARAWQPHLVILGRSPEPTAEPDWLQNLRTEAEIRQALIARASAGATPRAIATQMQQIQTARDISQQLHRLRSLGVTVDYHSVDVRDPYRVRPILAGVREKLGPIRGIIHGAGVLADHRIEDKTCEQFEMVYQTKVVGLQTLLECVDPKALRFLGLFSSYTARFGRIGQSDYAMANEVLNKLGRQFAVEHPGRHVAAFNWGPWDGGMVQGGLKHLFDAEGVGLIPLDAGAEFVVREFEQTASRPVEILVLADREAASHEAPAPLSNEFKVAFERVLDVANSPYLESHVLGGKAVLPVAMILEWLAHGAIHRNPGLELQGIEDFRVYQGVRLGRQDRLTLRVQAGKPTRQGSLFKAPMRLVRIENAREVLHAAGTVILGADYAAPAATQAPLPTHLYSIDTSAAYSSRLFHGAQFRAITSIESCLKEGIAVKARSAPAASAWMVDPVRANWLADPLVIDAALQAIILWSQEVNSRPCLPCAIGKYHQYSRAFPRTGVLIVVRVRPQSGQLIHCDVEFIDDHGRLVAKMENCESVADPSLSAAFRKNQIDG